MQKKLEHNGVAFVLEIESDIESNRFESAFSKEPETIAWIEEVMCDGEILLDVGANIGIFSLFAAARHPHSIVYACEPAFHNFFKLCTNAVSNGFDGRVMPLGIAIGEHAGLAELHLSSLALGSASHAIDTRAPQKNPDEKTFSHLIATVPIDGLVGTDHVQKPHHIKIDVDGMEAAVVQGTSAYLKDPTLKSILLELDHKLSDAESIITHIENAGFNRLHPLNTRSNHSRVRRAEAGHSHIENIIFTRPQS